eukprot:2920702-Rhodomonas_salina.6
MLHVSASHGRVSNSAHVARLQHSNMRSLSPSVAKHSVRVGYLSCRAPWQMSVPDISQQRRVIWLPVELDVPYSPYPASFSARRMHADLSTGHGVAGV